MKLNHATNIPVYSCTFVNSSRYAVNFSGNNVSISHNTFNGGLDAEVRSHSVTGTYYIYGTQITRNDVRNYRAAGIAILRTEGAQVSNNHLYHNHFGDPYGGDVGQAWQGGGQSYLGAFARNSSLSSNRIDGAYWEGSGARPPFSTYPIMNYGVEVDGLQEPGMNNHFSSNTVSNHRVSGYWSGGNNQNVTLTGETVSYNRVAGVQATQNALGSSAIKIRGVWFQYNEGSQWPNGAKYPKWYGLHMDGVAAGGICITNDAVLLPNWSGEQCQVSGSGCVSPITSSFRSSVCP